MNFETGQLTQSEDPSWIGRCLNERKLSRINHYLTDNSLCEIENDVPDDRMCSMVYTFPYMEVFVGEDEVRTKVGEATSACPETEVVLCDNNDSAEGMIRNLDIDNDFNKSHCP